MTHRTQPSRDGSPRSDCLSDPDVRDVFEGCAEEEVRNAALAHLADCDRCRDRLAMLQPAPEMPADYEAQPGMQLSGRYTLREPVGDGQWGEVWSAFDERLRRIVAVKILLAHRAMNPDDHFRIVREAEALAQLQHPNIVGVHDHGVHRGRPYLVMEYVDGVPLRTHIEEQRPSLAQVLTLFVHAARGMAAAHRAAIVHRDFKADNVLVDAAGQVRITDFGLAAALSAPPLASDTSDEEQFRQTQSALDQRLTPTAGGLGTPAYMAPELWRGERATPWSDQFAFCASLAEALCGRAFLDRADMLGRGITRADLNERLKPVASWLRPVLARGLDADLTQRYPDLDALASDIRSRRRRRTLRFAAATVGVAAVLAGLGANAVREARIQRCIPAAPIGEFVDEAASAAVHATHEALTAYRHDRLAQYAEVCRDGHGRPTEAPAGTRARFFCLEEATVTEAVVRRTMLSDPRAVQGWHLLGRLPALSNCRAADETAIGTYGRFAAAGTKRQEELMELLAREHNGDIRQGLEAMLARELPQSFAADVHVALAAQLANMELAADAEASFRRGLAAALASSNHRAALVALLGLVRLVEHDSPQAQLLLQLAEPIAIELGTTMSLRHAHARRHLAAGDLEAAMLAVEAGLGSNASAQSSVAGLRQRFSALRLLRTKAEILRLQRFPLKALETARAAAQGQREVGGEDFVYAIALAQLGGYAERADAPDEAGHAFRKAAELFDEFERPALAARARVQRARQLTRTLRWDDAVRVLQNVITSSQGVAGDRDVASAATYLAYVHRTAGRPTAQKRACETAMAAGRRGYSDGHLRAMETEVFCLDGAANNDAGRLREIVSDVSDRMSTLTAREQITARGVATTAHTTLARVALAAGDFAAAEHHGRAGLELAAASHDAQEHPNWVPALLLAQALAHRGAHDDARERAEAVLTTIRPTDNDAEAAEHIVEAAKVLHLAAPTNDRASRLLDEAATRFVAANLARRADEAHTLRQAWSTSAVASAASTDARSAE